MANAYFQIIMNGTKTFLRIFPATEGGQGLSAKEIQEYLSFNNKVPETTDYLMIAGSATEQTDVLLCNKTGFAINEYLKLALSQDKMMAVARFTLHHQAERDLQRMKSLMTSSIKVLLLNQLKVQ